MTRQYSKQELLTFNEFFLEVGVEVGDADVMCEVSAVARRMASNLDFVLQRLGYETLVLRTNDDAQTISWQRRLCCITLKSELRNPYPSDFTIIAAGRFSRLGKALLSGEGFVLIGTHECLAHVLNRQAQPLVKLMDSIGRHTLPRIVCPLQGNP